MPAKSPEQFGAMQAAMHNKGTLGIPQNVGKKFVDKTSKSKRKSFAKSLASKRKKNY